MACTWQIGKTPSTLCVCARNTFPARCVRPDRRQATQPQGHQRGTHLASNSETAVGPACNFSLWTTGPFIPPNPPPVVRGEPWGRDGAWHSRPWRRTRESKSSRVPSSPVPALPVQGLQQAGAPLAGSFSRCFPARQYMGCAVFPAHNLPSAPSSHVHDALKTSGPVNSLSGHCPIVAQTPTRPHAHYCKPAHALAHPTPTPTRPLPLPSCAHAARVYCTYLGTLHLGSCCSLKHLPFQSFSVSSTLIQPPPPSALLSSSPHPFIPSPRPFLPDLLLQKGTPSLATPSDETQEGGVHRRARVGLDLTVETRRTTPLRARPTYAFFLYIRLGERPSKPIRRDKRREKPIRTEIELFLGFGRPRNHRPPRTHQFPHFCSFSSFLSLRYHDSHRSEIDPKSTSPTNSRRRTPRSVDPANVVNPVRPYSSFRSWLPRERREHYMTSGSRRSSE